MKSYLNFIVLFLLAFTASFAQNSLNDYKYVIVPNKYEFLKSADEYRLNWLTKSLFKDLNFEALMDNDVLPQELKNNACLALKADVLDESNMFRTRLKIQLKNCDGEVVYTSGIGESREKKYKKAYHETLRKAFKFLEKENYSYKPNKNILTKGESSSIVEVKEIEKLKKEIKELKAEKKAKKIKQVEVDKQPIVKQVVTTKKEVVEKESTNDKVLTAALIPGSVFSYEVKNSRGEVLYTLLFSGQQDIYMVKGKDALVYKINGVWAIAQYKDDSLEVKSLDIKF